jgi:aspartate aminotransferase-like enzyme
MKKNLLFIPGPVTVAENVLAAMSKPLIDHRGPNFAALAKRIDEGLRPIFGTQDADIILLGSSGTGGGLLQLQKPMASTSTFWRRIPVTRSIRRRLRSA